MNATMWSAQLQVPVLPNRDHIRGSDFARVTLLEYGDYECPYCRVAHAIINRIQTQLQSQMRFVFLGVNGTPTFYINSVRDDGAWDFSALSTALSGAMSPPIGVEG